MISRFNGRARQWTLSAATGVFVLSSGVSMAQQPRTSAAPYTPQNTLQNAVQREMNQLYGQPPQVLPTITSRDAAPATGQTTSTRSLTSSRTRPGSGYRSSRTSSNRTAPAPAPQISPSPRDVQQVQYQNGSPVINELNKLYQQDGRPVPNMQVPNYQKPAENQPQAVAQKKPGLMGRIFPFMKKKSQPQPQPPQQSAPPQVAPAPVAQQPVLTQVPPAPAPAPIVEQPVAPAPQAVSPVGALDELPVLVESTPEPQPAPLDSLDNPFTEESESEADSGSSSPFSGLALDDVTAAPAPTPAPTPAPAEEPNPFAVLAEEEAESVADANEPEAPELAPATILPAEPSEAAEPQAELPKVAAKPEHTEKLKKIAERQGMSGLKGFCIVSLRDARELVDTVPEFSSIHGLKTYYFATEDAKARFDAEPTKYAPASDGYDVVVLAEASQEVEGTLDHAAWYRGQLFLFSTAESKAKFRNDPAQFAGDVE